ncbi:Alginate o-acetyltransferase AlgI [Pseudomonas syringae pv. spinaceae]|uniref:Alginate o-acetyltransferase AlgI n=1 Tax=Pseudomonas syringae pv. spinaceae TaxID=264459 RepID=A0A0Q0FZ85_PSESX|nr:Alginate o-acetyltransferase AlgI [Pseudomonas syringae pv. spinaceae]
MQAGQAGAVEFGQLPVAEAEHGTVHTAGHVQVFRAEDHPADHDQQEGQSPADHIEAVRLGVDADRFLDGQPHAVPGTPDDVGDVGTVPQTAQQHCQEQVAIGRDLAATVAAQGDVQVVTQPSGQADVPATPELGDRLADVRLFEVFHKAETHHQAQANRHVAVTGEVEIKLRGVGQRTEPGITRGRVLQGEAVVGDNGQGVGDEHFLDEALHESRGTLGELVQRVGPVVELIGQITETQHGPGNQVREDRNECREVDQVASGRGIAAVHVDDVADGLEDIERDPDRQQHVGQDERFQAHRGHGRIDAVHAEVGVFEVAQNAQVYDYAEQQPALCRFGPHTCCAHFEADPVVPDGHADEQRQEVHTPPGVEDIAGNQQ